MAEMYYFQTSHLDVGYDKKAIVKDVTLSLKKGEILTLIGPNGAGKTTVLKSIIQQLKPLAGTVCLDSADLIGMNEKTLAKKLSVVLTGRITPELMTCGEVVATGRYPYTGTFGILSEKDKEIAAQSIRAVRAEELTDQLFLAVSDGQKQRIMLARALCQEPELLVLDEPTSYLDLRYKLEFLSVLQRMSKERKLTVILSLHELDLAERISDRIACVKDGVIDRFGSPDDIFRGEYIAQLFGLREGSYQSQTGQAELTGISGKPRVFVIAGCGYGAPVFRSLQRQGIPFAAGILPENDLDYPAAKALAAEIISIPAFAPVGEAAFARAKQQMESCESVICALPLDELPDSEFVRCLKRLLSDR